MIENSDPTLFILGSVTLMMAVLMIGFGAILWVTLSKYRAAINQLEQENSELRKLLHQYTQKVKDRI